MRYILSMLAVLFIAAPVFAQHEDSLTKIYFDTDQASISETEQAKVEQVAERLKAGDFTLILIGSADKRGKRLYNLELAEKRAATVEGALKELGVEGEILFAFSRGEESPSAPADDLPAHLQENRRVDIFSIPPTIEIQKVEIKAPYKNRIALYGGGGPQTLDQTDHGSYIDVDWEFQPVFGLGYSRLITERWSIGVAGFTNATFTLNVGLDF